jgi:ABC-type spermidine/putrescine transport system permease subunit II
MSSAINNRRRKICRTLALFASLAVPSIVSAQSCALCYTQAAGSGDRLVQALRSGVVILVVPPMLICIGIAVMAYKKRNQFNED